MYRCCFNTQKFTVAHNGQKCHGIVGLQNKQICATQFLFVKVIKDTRIPTWKKNSSEKLTKAPIYYDGPAHNKVRVNHNCGLDVASHRVLPSE